MTEIKADIDFIEMAGDIKVIKKLLLGNGTIGLCERVGKLENCQNKSSKLSGFFSGLWIVVGGVITLLFNHFRG